MSKLRLYLCHAQGRYGENCYVPLSVGVLWAYAQTFPEIAATYEMVDFLYLKEPIEKAVARLENPDLVGLAHYVWNAEWNKAFAQAIKKKWPNCTIIVGGVQVPDESPRILQENPDFDFAIYGEGEGAFADFLRMFARWNDIEDCGWESTFAKVGSLIWWRDKHEITVNPRREFTDLAQLRSPYLDGVFDDLWSREPRWQVLQEFDRGCPYLSFSGDTLIALPDRILRFDEEKYSENDVLPCADYRHRHRLSTTDNRVVKQGPRECLKLSFSNGLSLTVTVEHPMFAVFDEVIVDAKACELNVGDWIPVEVGQNAVDDYVALEEPSKTEAEIRAEQGSGQGRRVPDAVNLPKLLNEKVAWLTGYLVGDGCLPTDNRSTVMFAVKERSRVTLSALISDLFDLDLHITESSFTSKMQHGAIHSRKVTQFFRESLEIAPGEMKLRVPRAIFRSPRAVVRAFLDGLWCADGYWPDASEPYLTTVSEQLAEECAALIHWIGDAAVVRRVRGDNGKSKREFCYRVEWHGDACRKRVYGKPCVLSRVPAIRHTYRDHGGQLRLRQTPQGRNREGSPREVLRHFTPKHPLLDERFTYVQVTAVEPAGVQETYDVHHHPEHKVAANGVFVRQCAMCAWGQAALNDIRLFPEERIRAELEWFGQHKVDYLDQADANYGIVKRDISLTDAVVETKRKYGFPRTFRTSFAKNSNETIWDIANKLHSAGMLKSVTLAMQSMDDGVLVNIRRKNIKFDKFGVLVQRYEEAGIPTYTELIIGLAGETLDGFLDGMERCLVAGQHTGLFCYLNISLENTEQRDPKYVEAHGLRTVAMQAMLTHGTPDNSVPREKQDIVVETTAMPHDDWKRAYLHAKVVEVFHAQGLLQEIAIERGMRYRDFYSDLLDWCLANPETVAGREITSISLLLDNVLAGGSWDCIDPRLGDISWPPEEFAFAHICLELDRFYDEIKSFLWRNSPGWEAQRPLIAPPWEDTVAWAREVVWYGRKGYAKNKRKAAVK